MFIHFLNKTKPHKWTLITVSCLICFYDFENQKFLPGGVLEVFFPSPPQVGKEQRESSWKGEMICTDFIHIELDGH